jgi:hypothetical protein
MRSFTDRILDEPLDSLRRRSVNHRADVGFRIQGVPILEGCRNFRQPQGELVGHLLLDQTPVDGGAALSRVAEGAHGHPNRLIQVGVGKYGKSRVPAQLRDVANQLVSIACHGSGDRPTHRLTASETHQFHSTIGDERFHQRRDRTAGHHVQ